MSDRQRHGFVLLIVAGLIAASTFVLFTQPTRLGLDLKGGVQLVYQGEPTAQTPHVTQEALARAVDIMRSRVDSLGVTDPVIQTSGGNQISAGLPAVTDIKRAEQEVGSTARLYFYDWEANVLTPPSGKPAASLLPSQDPTATTLSQGLGSAAQPGQTGAGGLPLYQAVKLAAAQPYSASKTNSRFGSEYFVFGAPGSAACATAARDRHSAVAAGVHCLLSQPPVSEIPGTPAAQVQQDLSSSLPPGVRLSDGQTLEVKRGTVLLQAADASFNPSPSFGNPAKEFYVLHDNVALQGTDITNPAQGTDQAGQPDVQFSFAGNGQNAFQNVTAAIAHRGALDSPFHQTLNQHFAVALDAKLITVPQIEFRTFPDGITGGGGADITGGFTIQSAQDLATQLRLGALPIRLVRISESQVSATLGKQSLHQGLIAGAVGLLVVAIFLIAYYRVLGLIAVAALITYSLYFYALIKLIPITLTLPGIAGLILTIGVAADANIVIFERVKEEIRAGRSIRSGIATGYKKGLTAIIDANVVTIMTAFILFVLATAEVQGFAFVLGIGTIVSLFTAVLATQAILMSMGDSRTIGRRSALGVGDTPRVWRFDFMGASRYFFSMSGVILLIGALAIGGRGLNLGIDFTSGTRITANLVKPASQSQVSAVLSSAGAANAQVQQVANPALGAHVFQISAKKLSSVSGIQSALQTHFGLKTPIDSNTIGPSFGRTIANSAVIAIIASLLVISAYVALRFQWKFAVPVLIALMHDLLITAGVYSLTGREVTTSTVAALLTILGYSLYDTIIVFDRVRENIPRMPRAAFSQIVNRSMSEVLTRSIATTACTLMPIVALLLFGGATLQDFAFALMIGVASGAYSSIFIASPVLTHWKEREPVYRHRHDRILAEHGSVPAYASVGSDVDPAGDRTRRRPGARLTTPASENVSAAEFEQMKRDLALEEDRASRATSTLTRRPPPAPRGPAKPAPPATPSGGPFPEASEAPGAKRRGGNGAQRAPDEAENEGIAPQAPKPSRPARKSRNKRHGRPR